MAANTITQADLKEKLRQKMDAAPFTVDDWFGTSFVDSVLVDSSNSLFAKLSKLDQLVGRPAALRTIAGSNQLFVSDQLEQQSLPPFLKLFKLMLARPFNGNTGPVEFFCTPFEDINGWGGAGMNWTNGTSFSYRLIENDIYVFPTPAAAYDLLLYYAPKSTLTTSPTSTIPDNPGWSDWLVYDAAVSLCLKEDRSPNLYVQLRDNVWENVISFMEPRDETGIRQIRRLYSNAFSPGVNSHRNLPWRRYT